MIRDEQVLDEDTVPEEELVVHRQEEYRRLYQSLREDSTGDLTYLLGPTGTGKTMCAQIAADRRTGINGPKTSHIDCWGNYERLDVLCRAVADLRDNVVAHRQSTPRAQLLDYLREPADGTRVVILDEADQLHDRAVIYDLIESPALHVVLIANNEDDLFDGIDDRLRSRLAVGTRIMFPEYSATELSAILSKRAEHAFHYGHAVTDRQLDHFAEAADGDARVAIRCLREAAEMARNQNCERISDEHVEKSIPLAKRRLRQKSRDKMNQHQNAVLDVVDEHGPLRSTAIAEHYQDLVDEPRGDRRVRTYLSKLVHYNHLRKTGPDHAPAYEKIG